MSSPAINPVQKLAYVEHQVRNAARHEDEGLNAIDCPYCGLSMALGSPSLCCALMGEAVTAILHRMEVQDQLDAAERILEGADRQGRSSLVH